MLQLADWQYIVNHHSIGDFTKGDIVFLKSNPETQMKVMGYKGNEVECMWFMPSGEARISTFVPETILHYRYRALLFNGKFPNITICLN